MADAPLFTIIFGPTASGKSALAYDLANQLNTDILSFDSRHIYQGMDVVTGKDLPPADWPLELLGIDLVPPNADFSIRHYYEYAAPIITKYRQRQQPLILVGGSWQYVDVLLNPPASLLIPQDSAWRQQAERHSISELQRELSQLDHRKWLAMNNSDQNNPRRLIRAIEVARHPQTKQATALIRKNEYQLQLLSVPLSDLEDRIAKRIEARLQQGALEETKQLIKLYPEWNTPAFDATGYRLLRDFIEDKIDLITLRTSWLQQERDYAKRQLTWMRSLQSPN